MIYLSTGTQQAKKAMQNGNLDSVKEPRLNKPKEPTSKNSEVEEGSTYRDEIAAAIHEGLDDLASIGALDPAAVGEFEAVSLMALPQFTAEKVRELRAREDATQVVFAHHLGVSVNTVSQWERGERNVTGSAAKLLSLVQKYGLSHLV
jgi:putative transcriptional regulator